MFGILIFNGDRPDIALENGTLYGACTAAIASDITLMAGCMCGWNIMRTSGYLFAMRILFLSNMEHKSIYKAEHYINRL